MFCYHQNALCREGKEKKKETQNSICPQIRQTVQGSTGDEHSWAVGSQHCPAAAPYVHTTVTTLQPSVQPHEGTQCPWWAQKAQQLHRRCNNSASELLQRP